ncbi:aminopeptidase N [uncultured Jatrophihabitans sp.]|uniref:aminopeptidase N n=1 Tax=uncultured Jatrophihabitans sp. TaxID=1610747 RepID=UPI0035CBB7FE
MTSLTRVDAVRRAAQLDVLGYRVALNLTGDEHTFGSTTTIEFDSASDEETFADVAPARLHSATLNGARLDLAEDFDAAGRRLRVRPRAGGNTLVVDAAMSYSRDGEGLHRQVDPVDSRVYLYAMSFLDAAPRWFACFDQPDLKATLELDVRCPADWRVIGNGPATEQAPGHWTVAATGPLATYFTTLVAGPYHVVRSSHDGIPLGLHCRQSLAEHLDRDAEELFDVTRRSFDRLHEMFGHRYPWGEYHQAFVPEFNAGAMENPGCVTFRDTMVFRSRVTDSDRLERATTVAHEMAHMWFGDLVTMRWWDDLWLNESFAEYLGHEVLGDTAWVTFGARRKAWGVAADRRPSTHPVAGNGAADAASALNDFDGISYAKGASVLRQLAAYLGPDVFLAGLRRHIGAHAHGNAELADLLGAWTAEGAVDMPGWAQTWLRTTGLDVLSAADGAVLRRSPRGTPRRHAVTARVFGPGGAELGAQQLLVDADRTAVDLPAGVLVPDADDETWAQLELPADTWRSLPGLLPGIASPRTRVALWNALRLAVADAHVSPAVAVDIAVAALPAEPDDVLGPVGRWAAATLLDRYVADAQQPAAAARLASAALTALPGAAAGSSRQLALARLLVAVTPDSGLLRRWLADGPDADGATGLDIDAELRWAITLRLAGAGEFGAAEIAAEARRDASSQGAVHAARCRAAQPDPAAKDAAWTALMSDAAMPNYELYAAAEGFWHVGQQQLTAPYVERFFDEIGTAATLRSGWVNTALARLAYPWPAARQTTLDATERLLGDRTLDVGMRRSVMDAADDLRRVLASRLAFP